LDTGAAADDLALYVLAPDAPIPILSLRPLSASAGGPGVDEVLSFQAQVQRDYFSPSWTAGTGDGQGRIRCR